MQVMAFKGRLHSSALIVSASLLDDAQPSELCYLILGDYCMGARANTTTLGSRYDTEEA